MKPRNVAGHLESCSRGAVCLLRKKKIRELLVLQQGPTARLLAEEHSSLTEKYLKFLARVGVFLHPRSRASVTHACAEAQLCKNSTDSIFLLGKRSGGGCVLPWKAEKGLKAQYEAESTDYTSRYHGHAETFAFTLLPTAMIGNIPDSIPALVPGPSLGRVTLCCSP